MQPPPYTKDDPAALEMMLEYLASLQYLYKIRKEILAGSTDHDSFKAVDWSVRGTLMLYSLNNF